MKTKQTIINLVLEGLLLAIKKEIKEGIKVLEELIKCLEKSNESNIQNEIVVKLWFLIGMMYERLEKNEEAVDCYTKAERINPNYAELLYEKGRIYYYHMNRKEEGINYLKRAIELKPELFKKILQ